MSGEAYRIPINDYLGRKVKIGNHATIFTNRGIHYEGVIQQIGGKRWFVVDKYMKIGGIGNCLLMKD